MLFIGTTKNLHFELPILRFAQDDSPYGARARSTAPLTPCRAWEITFSFERWGIEPGGKIFCSGDL